VNIFELILLGYLAGFCPEVNCFMLYFSIYLTYAEITALQLAAELN